MNEHSQLLSKAEVNAARFFNGFSNAIKDTSFKTNPRYHYTRRLLDQPPYPLTSHKDWYREICDKLIPFYKQPRLDLNSSVHSLLSYQAYLPEINLKNIKEVIDEMVSNQPKTRLLDIGCGNGQALLDASHLWGNKVECWGLTAYPFHINEDSSDKIIHSQLRLHDVNIELGDAHFANRYLPREFFDVVISAATIEHLIDPWAMVQGAYDILKPGGVGLLGRFQQQITSNADSTKLQRYLKNYGIYFVPDRAARSLNWEKKDIPGAIAIVKRSGSLRLPLRPFFASNLFELNGEKVKRPTLEYCFDQASDIYT